MRIFVYKSNGSFIKEIPYIDDTILNDLIAEHGKIYIKYIDDRGKGIKIIDNWYIG